MDQTEQTVLVTGAGGFVGFATIQNLLDKGFNVRAFELAGSPYVADLKHLARSKPALTVIEGDIRQKADIQNAIGDAQYFIHSAALLNSIAPYETFYDINVKGTENALAVASEHKIKRFLLVSTSDVFGIPETGETISEDTPYRRWNEPYADTKIEACKRVKSMATTMGLDYTIIYPGWVYGPGDKQFFPAIIDMLKDKHTFLWHRKSPYHIDFIYIQDLVSAITNALIHPNAANEDFLILNDQAALAPLDVYRWMADYLSLDIRIHKVPYSLMMLIAKTSQWLCQKGITKTHLLSSTDVKAFGNDFNFNANKAEKLLGWKCITPEEQGFTNFFEWYLCQNGQSNQPESCYD